MQVWIELYSEYTLMDQSREAKGKKNEEDANACKEEGLEMEYKVGHDKHDWESGKRSIFL